MTKAIHPPRWREYAPPYIFKWLADPLFGKPSVRRWVEEQLWCPACGHLCKLDHEDENGDYDEREMLLSIHGDEGIAECVCEHCGATFHGNEYVRRTFHTAHTWEDACSPRSSCDIDLSFGENDEHVSSP
jgi:hypothetical protein